MAVNATTGVVAATTGSTQILGANAGATYRRLQSSGTVFFGTVAGVTTATGFRLQATDAPFIMSSYGMVPGAGIYTGALFGVATTTGSSIYAFEV